MAPSLAVGAPIVVKPASSTPIGSLRLAEFFAETDLPKAMYQVLPVRSKVADQMARDDRYRKISFTGSAGVGWYLKGLDPKKRVTLELGGNAGVIVHADADLDLAAQRIAFGGYYQAGQSCISVQRVLVSSEIYDEFATRLTKQVEQLKTGDPMDPTVDVGPVIDRGEVDRIQEWVSEAVAAGRRTAHRWHGRRSVLHAHPHLADHAGDEGAMRGGVRPGRHDQPVRDVRRRARERSTTRSTGCRPACSRTISTARCRRTARWRSGGVIINDVSAFRADQMPYGGSKDSGFGREGLRFAMEEMTEQRIMVLSHVPL